MRTCFSIFFALVVLAIVPSCGDEPEKDSSKVKVGDHVPGFVVSDAYDNLYWWSSDFFGKKTLLLLFDITCPDCKDEFPVIDQVWKNLKDDPECLVITISRIADIYTKERDILEIELWWDMNRFTMPVYYDNNRAVYNAFARSGVPRIYVIDPNGVIRWMAVEKNDLSADELTEMVKTIEPEPIERVSQ